jgi:nucleoid-associated protein YgaU
MQYRIKLLVPLCAVALSFGTAQAQESTDFQASTNNVLAALGAAPVETEVVVEGDLLELVGEAMARGETTDYINALVLEAHSDGQIAVPDSMTNNEGEVDTAALLASVVGAAIAGQPAQPADDNAALEAEAQGDQVAVEGLGQTHTVIAGDTLRKLAINYYGDMGAYRRILDANPVITNENLIKIGQVLQIP